MNNKLPIKIAVGLILFGIIGMLLISAISIAEYGKVYMYDGYESTGVLWTICFIAIGLGITMLVGYVTSDKYPKISSIVWKIFIIILAAAVIMLVLKSCGMFDDLFGSGSGSGGKCGVCGGSGLVPKDGFGYTKCPYCKGSGVPPL